MSPLIIGLGNRDRGDDAAGLIAVRRLREHGLRAMEHSGDGLSLIERFQEAADVILIDAVVTGAKPGAVTVWDARSAPLDDSVFCYSTHSFGVADALRLGTELGRLPLRMSIYGIEAARFAAGRRPTSKVLSGVEEAVRLIMNEVTRCTNRP